MRLIIILLAIPLLASCNATQENLRPQKEPKFETYWIQNGLDGRLNEIYRRRCKLNAKAVKRAEDNRIDAERQSNPWMNLAPRNSRQVYNDYYYLCMLESGYTPKEKCVRNCKQG